jgi:hypothetical protein
MNCKRFYTVSGAKTAEKRGEKHEEVEINQNENHVGNDLLYTDYLLSGRRRLLKTDAEKPALAEPESDKKRGGDGGGDGRRRPL